jgi:excisionase family DNA binding protein
MVQLITGDTPLYQLSVNQLLELLNRRPEAQPQQKIEPTEKKYIYGISGLARLLNCSNPTAQRIKDSGKIPYTQVGRKLIFDSEEVLKALNRKK